MSGVFSRAAEKLAVAGPCNKGAAPAPGALSAAKYPVDPSCRLSSGGSAGNQSHPVSISSRLVRAAALGALLVPGQTPAQAPSASRFVVVLDAAHGGDDAGARLTAADTATEPEKTYTLALSVRLRSLLAARGITVVTTRESDIALGPQQRAQIANRARAQACLSLHAAMSGSGVHLFLSSLAPAPPATFVPWKTAQAAWVPRSIALAGMLNSALTHAGIKVTIGRTALPAIDSMTCPAVAVEVGPPQPTQPSGRPASIGDDAYQAQISDAIAAGLLEWRSVPPGEEQNP